MKRFSCFVLAVFMLSLFVGCGSKTAPNLFLFGISDLEGLKDMPGAAPAASGGAVAAKREITEFLTSFEKSVATDIAGSDLDKINRAQAGEAVTVGADTAALLALAKRVHAETGGAFNPAMFALSKAWGFSPEFEGRYSVPRPEPEQEEIERLLPYCNFNTVALSGVTVIKGYSKTQLDLGGIAKGYAADRAAEIAKKYGCYGVVDIGGNLYMVGEKPEGKPYQIGLRDPRGSEWTEFNSLFSIVSVKDSSVAVSGDYERYYLYEGRRYCHILDPATGKPADRGVVSVAVVNSVSAAADAYGTAAFALGQKASAELFEEMGLNSVIIFEENGVYYYRTTGNIQFTAGGAGWTVYGEYHPWTDEKN